MRDFRYRSVWLYGFSGAILLVAAAPTASNPTPKLLVAVQCPGGTPLTTEPLEDDQGLRADECDRWPLAYLTELDLDWASSKPFPDGFADGEAEALAAAVKPGWPRTFPRFIAQTLATADLGDPRGRASVLHEDNGRTHALAPDGTPAQGWPILLPQPFTSTMPAVMNVDEVGPEEILLGLREIHLLAHTGVEWSGWPFLVPNTGFQGISPIATRLEAGGPVSVVTGTGGARLFVIDQDAVPLPGWPVQIPKGVFAAPILSNVAVGDIVGGPEPEIVATIGNERQVFAYNQAGQLLAGFPVQRSGQAQEPSLADLDGDGKLEILLWADFNSSTPGILALTGAGQVLPGWPRPVQSGTGNFGVAVGDVDGDGNLEVLASTINGAEAGAGGVYLWHGDGTPVSGWPKFFPNVSFPNPVAIADVDGDGIGDPVVAGFSVVPPTNGLVYAWKGNGQLLPGFPIVIPFRPVGFGSPTIDDLEGDGIADLGITTTQALNILLPGHVHWFDLGVPYRAEGMEWPTRSHDMARTAAYRPPVRRVAIDLQIAPPLINTRTPAPPLTVILRPPPEETARPSLLRLRFVNGQRVEELEGTRLADDDPEAAGILADLDGTDGDAVVFRLDGEAVRALLPGPGEHFLGCWTEAVGGLDGVLYEGEATLALRDLPRRPVPRDLRARRPRLPLTGGSVPLTPAPVSTH